MDSGKGRSKEKSMNKIESFWQWLVLIAAVLVNAIAGGITYSFGVIYTDIRDRLETPPTQAVITGAIAFACYCFVAPFTRALTGKLGSRIVTVLGSMVASLGLILCAVAPTIHYYYVFFGMLVGGGYGMVSVASWMIVRDYFYHKPGLAITLLSCGFPVGVFIFSLIIRALYDTFSYFGMFLVSSAIMMNGIVCGLLFRPISKVSKKEIGDYEQMDNPEENNICYTPTVTESDEPASTSLPPTVNNVSDEEAKETLKPGNRRTYKAVTGPTEERHFSTLETSFKFDDTFLHESEDDEADAEDTVEEAVKPSETAKPPDIPDGDSNTPEELTNEPQTEELKPLVTTLLGVITGVSDTKQLCQWRLILFVLACMVYSLGYGIPYCFFPDIAKLYGYDDSKAIWALSLMGLSSTISVIIFGAVTRLATLRLGGASILIAALSAIAFGLVIGFTRYFTDFAILLLSCLLNGFFSIIFFFIKEHMLTEIQTDPDVGPYMSFSTWCSGFGFLIGIPVAGWLREQDGDYNSCFVMTACCCGFTALFLSPLLIWRRIVNQQYTVST